MERRSFVMGLAWLAGALVSGCGSKKPAEEPVEIEQLELTEPETDGAEQKPAAQEPAEGDAMNAADNRLRIRVAVNGTPFTATLEDGPAAEDLLSALPLTLHMEELHGNEKYNYTDVQFSGDEYVPDVIQTGDLMVYSDTCLVLFYETFDNPGHAYQYVGRIDDVSKLAEVCGSNSVMVDFEPLG
ncbi:MAG: cyclophilin-like fold protein [Coriobacteriales bacterium]|nr:cyclophilin-like fold protein [Coriobacteriales bacterium]